MTDPDPFTELYRMDNPEESMDDAYADNVADHLGCPNCGETRVDYLEILEDDLVHCLSCQRTYDLTAEPDDEDFPLTNTIAADESDGVFFAIAHESGEL